MNPYEKLDIETDATKADIKKAYRRKAQECHPDRPDGNKEEFQAVKLAYEVLSNPERRKKFDEFGDIDEAPKQNIAEQMVMNFFNAMIDNGDMSGNIIDRTIEAINREQNKCKNDIAKAAQKLAALEKKKNRINAKGNNLFDGLLVQKIEVLSRGITQAKEMIGNFDTALELLADYEDTAPEIITTSTYATFGGLQGAGQRQEAFFTRSR